eukprot:scaffold60663_cov75-Phaeocystis_antarctica.AAC.4
MEKRELADPVGGGPCCVRSASMCHHHRRLNASQSDTGRDLLWKAYVRPGCCAHASCDNAHTPRNTLALPEKRAVSFSSIASSSRTNHVFCADTRAMGRHGSGRRFFWGIKPASAVAKCVAGPVCHFASVCSHSTAVADDRVDVQVAHCRTCHATRIEVRQQRRLRQTADSVVEAGQNVDVSSLVQSTDELNPLVAAERVADE